MFSWDRWSSRSLPVCDSFDQLKHAEYVLMWVFDMIQSDLVNYTKCLIPCKYKEFKIVGEPEKLESGNQARIKLMMANMDIFEKNEELIYPFVSFVAEFGGSLGLFLGFSFMMIFDFFSGFIKGNLNLLC
jgi:hypothetical protein